jgi:hypothetical protein
MSQSLNEDDVMALETVANGLRGVCLDPSVPQHAKDALSQWIADLDAITDKLLDDEVGS